VAAPPLAEHGFELVGGRLLPGEAGPSAQFMYQDASGRRITLYVSRKRPDAAATATAFRFERAGNLQAFYWIDRSVGYVLSGDVGRERLATIATTVHRELGE
jgi:anti-sigma factor RsiW